MDIKARIKRTLILCLIGLAIGAGIGLYQIRSQTALVADKPDQLADMAGIQLGGPFTLTDQDGKTITEKDFPGQYKLVFFGFTFCPAICPTELQKMTEILNIIEKEEPELASKIAPVFISFDPERDTPAVLKDYLKPFHPRMTGLTGTATQVEDAKKAYRVYAVKVPMEGMSEYMMDHSTFLYFMSPQDKPLSIYKMEETAIAVAADIKTRMMDAIAPAHGE